MQFFLKMNKFILTERSLSHDFSLVLHPAAGPHGIALADPLTLAQNSDDMKKLVLDALWRIQKLPNLVRSFFQ
jgi:hypothetical protein